MKTGNYYISRFPLLFILLPLLFINTTNDFAVDIKLLSPLTKENIRIQVVVKNQSATSIMIAKTRTADFKRFATRPMGNYIIEMEKYLGNGYYLFEPTVETSPVPTHYSNDEQIFFPREKAITDTLTISRYSVSNTQPLLFSAGLYRVRVSFNPIESISLQQNNSAWVEFSVR